MAVRRLRWLLLAAFLNIGCLATGQSALAGSSPSFPKQPPPVWSWSNPSTNLQAWIGQFEENRRFGWHHNLHVQPLGGGGPDPHNYHIYSNGQNSWRVFDNGEQAVPPDGERIYTDTLSNVATQLASDVALDNKDPRLKTDLLARLPGDSDDLTSVLNRVNQQPSSTPPDPNPSPGSPPDISPGAQMTGNDCTAYFDFTAPKDPNRTTTMRVSTGDGNTITYQIPQGTGPQLIALSYTYPMTPPPGSPGPGFVVTATIVETGAVSGRAVVLHGGDPTSQQNGPDNFVGQLWTWGNASGYDTSGALAVQATGNQPYNDPSEAGTQSVNNSIALADHGSGTNCFGGGGSAGCFKVYVAPNPSAPAGNGAALASGTYDVNVINIGYSNHISWLNPSGTCFSNTSFLPVVRVGIITVNASGKIALAYDANWNPLTVSGNIAGPFTVPSSFIASIKPQEAGVCVSDNVANGEQAPLTLR